MGEPVSKQSISFACTWSTSTLVEGINFIAHSETECAVTLSREFMSQDQVNLVYYSTVI